MFDVRCELMKDLDFYFDIAQGSGSCCDEDVYVRATTGNLPTTFTAVDVNVIETVTVWLIFVPLFLLEFRFANTACRNM